MSQLYILEHFTSENPMYPDYFQPWFEQCHMFAGGLIQDWTDEDIAHDLEKMDHYIASSAPWEMTLYFNAKEPEFKPDLSMIGTVTGRLGYIALYMAMQKGTPTENLGLKAKNWYEVFAIYTFGLIAYANRDLTFMENNDAFNKEEFIVELCGEYLGEAVEASTTARLISPDSASAVVQDILGKVSEGKKAAAKKGGKAKAEKYKPLNDKVIHLYTTEHEPKNRSNRYAAKLIWEALTDADKLDAEGNAIISDENAPETLAKWIAKYKRSHH